MSRPRACAALIRDGKILMVQHRTQERTYWTLPGGGIEPGETPADAAVREVCEETGLRVTVDRLLFEGVYGNPQSPEYYYLVSLEMDQADADAALGIDPEERHLPGELRLLQGLAWHSLEDMRNDGQVAAVLAALEEPIQCIVVRTAAPDDKPILRQLLELYEYDFSEYTNDEIGPLGFYGYRYLDHYWTDPDRHPYLIHVNGHLAGFALVNRHPVDGEEPVWSMAEFFILRKYRSQGIGETVAVDIFNQWPGRWQVTQLDSHPGATAFWRKVIDRYTNGKYEEREAQWGSQTGTAQFFESRTQSS